MRYGIAYGIRELGSGVLDCVSGNVYYVNYSSESGSMPMASNSAISLSIPVISV